MRYVSWPNAISLLRLPLAVAFLLVDSASAQALVLGAFALTDFADGFLARRLGQRTRSGELLDPITDKLFVVTALTSFLVRGPLALWEYLLLLARDLYTSVASLLAWLWHWPIRFRARRGGKVVTVVQIVALLLLILQSRWLWVALVLAAAAGLYAIVDYTRAALDGLRARERAH